MTICDDMLGLAPLKVLRSIGCFVAGAPLPARGRFRDRQIWVGELEEVVPLVAYCATLELPLLDLPRRLAKATRI
jgi:hypothetical protein